MRCCLSAGDTQHVSSIKMLCVFGLSVCCVSMLAVYEAGRLGAAAQEQWWAAGGHTALLMSSVAAKSGAVGAKRRRQRTEAAGDKENLQ